MTPPSPIKVCEKAATPGARRALEVLRGLTLLKDFYLAGGTALAIRLGHRVSVDLDFFSAKNALGFAEREALKSAIRERRPIEIREESDGTLHLLLEGTLVSFFRYGYPLLRPNADWEGVALASLEDIGLMKLGALVGRGARKDFLDVYAVCHEVPLERLLKMADKKFRDSRDFAFQALKAMAYFDDAEKEPMPELLAPVDWPRVRAFFEREVPKAAARLLKG